MNQEIMHDIAVREIQAVLSRAEFQDLSIVSQPRATGTSFFQGNDRLCKVLKTKRGLRIEINVSLPKELSDIPGMETIEPETAYAKHYGTVRHIYKGESIPEIKLIITQAVLIFRKNISSKQTQVM